VVFSNFCPDEGSACTTVHLLEMQVLASLIRWFRFDLAVGRSLARSQARLMDILSHSCKSSLTIGTVNLN
jgi:hypothetical protein